jgi:hypothetical protein
MSLWETDEIITASRLNQKTLYVGEAEPSVKYEGQLWYQPSTRQLREFDGAAWHLLAVVDLDLTVSGLWTFDRDPGAPFAVASGSGRVDNLDADMVDGRHLADILSGRVELVSADDAQETAFITAAATEYTIKSYSLPANSYTRILALASGYVDGNDATQNGWTLRLKFGDTVVQSLKLTTTDTGSLPYVRYAAYSLVGGQAQTAPTTIAVTVEVDAVASGATIYAHCNSLYVLGVV